MSKLHDITRCIFPIYTSKMNQRGHALFWSQFDKFERVTKVTAAATKTADAVTGPFIAMDILNINFSINGQVEEKILDERRDLPLSAFTMEASLFSQLYGPSYRRLCNTRKGLLERADVAGQNLTIYGCFNYDFCPGDDYL
jgi:hypothetical protein